MITVDIVMPTGGSRGGVEYVIKAWTQSLISQKYNLRIFHITPGQIDYLDGYPKQWTIPITDSGEFHLDMKYCAEKYAYFVHEMGKPDICIATWIPLVTSACKSVINSLNLNTKLFSWLHSGIDIYKQLGWGGIEHLSFADHHLCISINNQDKILDTYPDASTFLIGNPVNPVHIPNYSPDDHTLCFIGRISQEKRLDVILNALFLAKDKSWKLLIAGTGDCSDSMKTLAHELNIQDRVEFLGWQEDPFHAVNSASILLIASDYEGFSITALEASSIGMTVITTPVSGCTDYIIPGLNGYFYDNSNPQNLADILDYLSDKKIPLCNRDSCAKSIYPYVSENYFKKVDNIINSVYYSL